MSPILTGVVASGISGNLVTTSFESIATTTLTSTQTDITFSSSGVWAGYKHLHMRFTGKTARTSGPNDGLAVYFNGDTTAANYYNQSWEFDMRNNNTWYGAAGNGGLSIGVPGNTIANYMGIGYFDIYDINSSHAKNGYSVGGFIQGGTASGQNNGAGVMANWLNTAAVTSVTVSASNGFLSGTRVSLYGIKG